ncbi:hypothetical protein [Methylobacterium nodulans]|uniref:Uncharacterized protein n=1 Tax=Methylobacterium nodulans (strain LMG 21967 / CNCM I-2342 / ORS 2060) TaxID=460265 RepID=B8IRN6_METNO|nr:hypothetical protein [Methylobacterium nodulans]ACL60586.1 hypothetical protein Mnod_5757 [Methylobacterium nodulans ORS 2060]
MNRRSLLAMLGLAPVAAPAALAAVKEASLAGSQIANVSAARISGRVTHAQLGAVSAARIEGGNITARSILIEKIPASRLRVETPIDPFCTDQDRLIGALSFGA